MHPTQEQKLGNFDISGIYVVRKNVSKKNIPRGYKHIKYISFAWYVLTILILILILILKTLRCMGNRMRL